MSSSDWYLLWDDLARLSNEEQRQRLERHRQNLTQVTGLLSSQQLEPLPIDYGPLFTGQLGLDHGGTGADLSGTGPGVLFQATSGADVTVGDLPFSFIDFSADAGAINQILVSDGAGGAFFSGVDLTSPNWRSGLLPPSAGGTGVNNSTRTLTISTNSGTLSFSAASKVLTIGENITITGASGKVLTLTTGLTVTTNDGTLNFSAASKTLTIGETITLTGSSSGLTLTVPATGTAALRASSATAGRVGFWSSATDISHDAALFWDNTNKYLGIGTASPATLLHVHSTSVPQTIVLSSFAPAFEFRDNAVQASRTCAGFFGFSTANGHYSALKGDMNFITASYDTDNSSFINLWTASNNSGGFAKRMSVHTNVGIFGTSFGASSVGVIAIANRTTAPTGNPTAGGVLYSASGGGTWRGSGGTVTTFGPAGPHCATCGYDAWTVAMRNDAWQAYCYICGHCGTKYEAGPASVLGLLSAEERAQMIKPGMRYADLAAMLD